MKTKKVLGLLLSAAMIAGVMTGCGNDGADASTNAGGSQASESKSGETQSGTEENGGTVEEAKAFWESMDPQVSGSIDIMCWSGDSVYHEDIGHQELTPADLTSQNYAMIYSMAKKFNEYYPNLKINLYAKADDPDGNDTSWDQELENFKAEHGKYPDIYASTMLSDDTAKGMVADLSVFADDSMYQSFNESLMEKMNYYGFQAGLQQFMEPWGVYVNKELAEDNNIDVPSPDWNIDDYTDFVSSADNKNFWGLIYGNATQIIQTGTQTVIAALDKNEKPDMASEQVMSLLDYIPQWSQYEIWAKNGEGAVDSAIMDDGWWWGYRFFCRNYVLTYTGDPWMLNTAAMPQNEDGTWPTNAVESGDWDIYPRPATEYQGNTVGICIDPMAIHNYAMDDGDPAWSDAEKAQLDLAYAFGSFWCGATEAMQARADQMWSNAGVLQPCLNDSFPLVTGDAFDEQMQIWYSVDTHTRYGDADKMPGFQYVVQLWKDGQIWDVSDKCYPWYVYEDGTRKECLYEWLNLTNADVVGVGVTEASWLDTVKANLPEWNTKMNARLEEAQKNLKEGLKTYYGFTDSDF